ncbi:MAG: choice-of-anchor A family protein, partial [Methanococcaceae archaeon]
MGTNKYFNRLMTIMLFFLAFVNITIANTPGGNCDLSGFTTFTQGGWGTAPKGNNPGTIREAYFTTVFPNGLIVGSTYTLTLTSSNAVQNFIPAGSTASKFTRNYVNVTSTDAGVLAGQLVALTLNVKFDEAGKIGTNSLNLKDLVINSGVFQGMTVSQFLTIANNIIGGSSTAYSYSDVNNAATSINENFDNGTVNKGFLNCPNTPLPASLGDKVWEDSNKNGLQDSGEPGVGAVAVLLYNCTGSFIGTTTTDASGNYAFTNLTPGDYKVKFVLPSGYTFTTINAGDDTKDSDADGVTGFTGCYTLTAGQNNITIDAGIQLTQAVLPVSPILECVTKNSNGSYTAHFGYNNPNNFTVTIPIGDNNKITPSANGDKGQPIVFNPGRTPYFPNADFTVVFDGSPLVWTLNGQTATASNTSVPCSEHIYIEKKWYDVNNNEIAVPSNLPANYKITAVSSLGTATATYVNGTLTVIYTNNSPALDNNGLWVPIGETYTVAEENLPAGYSAILGIGTFTSELPGGFAINPFNGLAKNGLHTVKNKITTTNDKADLSLIKSVDNQNPKNGDNITYTVTVTNHGPANATGIKIADILAQGLSFVSATSSQGTYDNVTGIWTVGSLVNNASASLSITVKIDQTNVTASTIDLGVAAGFNVFVLGNLTQPSSDTQGRVAAGGDVTLSNYSVGDQLPNSNGTVDVLIAGHNLTYTSGAVYNGNVVYGNASNLPVSLVSISNGTVRKDNPIDFASAGAYLENLSSQLSTKAVNGTTKFEWGGLTLTGTDPFLNVFVVSGSDLSAANSMAITVPNGAVVLVNISGTNVSWTGGLTVTGTEISNVLYNFYQATSLKLQGLDIRGSLLAPLADVNFVSGVINGQFIAKSVQGIGQFNFTKFIGNIPVEKEIINIAEVTAADQPDPDSTPGNSVDSEDDFSKVTVHVNANSNTSGSTGDGNSTWENVGGSFTFGEIVWSLKFNSDGSMLAGTIGGKVYLSTNYGQNWNRINTGMNVGFIWSIITNANGDVFAGTEQGIFKLNKNTTVWTAAGLQGKDVRALAIDKNGDLYAGTWGYGIFKSVDNGANWNLLF